MAATRLTDSQKSELVARYCDGAASQELAEAYGCSINTVTRVVKATLTASDYEQLKQQRARGGSKPPQSKEADPKAAAPEEPESQPELQSEPQPELRLEPQQPVVVEAEIQRELAAEPEPDLALAAPVVLAIADADDFADDFADDSDGDNCDGVDAEGDDADGDSDDFVEQFVAVPIALVGHSFQPVLCQPLGDAALPASVYMLVDKTVELQAKPLSDFPELGQLPAEEEGRQALMVFANPRQAKRHCGRTQRVIKVPDTRILERTAPYLVAQGITRVVMEGSLYSLPGS
ncbi:MAG: hypothetical protein NTW02_08735 [Cyanobium sp. LacPavin_0920_WC12_MAG_62_9]|nr:hypothetical protein [Cyanobium sp. LacPavin_0920_WC12_MAG_62_9]